MVKNRYLLAFDIMQLGNEISYFLMQVCGYIHAIRHQNVAAMDSYMKVMHEPIHVFSFIHDMLRLNCNEESDAFESAVISRIPDLVKLSR